MHLVREAPKRDRTGVAMVFDDFDLEGVNFPHDDPLVIKPIIRNNPVKKVLVDNGVSVEILLYDTFIRMGYNDSQLTPIDMPIYGFAGVEFSVETRQATQMLNFVVVKVGSTNNAIMGRTDIRDNDEKRGKPYEDLIPDPVAPENPEKVTFIGASLEEPLRGRLLRLLQENSDVFAWLATDMPSIDPELITHKLNMDLNRKTVKQRKKSFAPERQEVIKQEVEKLLDAERDLGFFLGLMVSKRGIEANLDKIKAILDMEPPQSIKDVQKLTRRVAILE
ncbi:uncharacterized protein LOC141690635 [Apium graveolens]|uniref:uncharacterized protein LOC141690635 n=1 Tax=Apium graveolens TaxID=4045 RepID=UPI003D7A08BF